MALNKQQVDYHNEQFRLAALSLGFTEHDANTFFRVLQHFFSFKCLPAETFVAANGPLLHSICTDVSCPSAKTSNCTAYPNNGTSPEPQPASVQKRDLLGLVSY